MFSVAAQNPNSSNVATRDVLLNGAAAKYGCSILNFFKRLTLDPGLSM